jgi:hypothetical protein
VTGFRECKLPMIESMTAGGPPRHRSVNAWVLVLVRRS